MTAQTILPANSAASGGFEVANSIRLNENAYLHKTPSGSGNRKTWTASVWVKGQPTTATNNIAGQAVFSAGDSATDRTHFYFTNGIFEFRTEISNTQQIITTNQVFTDPAAWYHIVVAVDSTQSTDTNRVKIYANGSQITSFSAAAYLAEDADTYVNHTVKQYVGSSSWSVGSYFNGYMAEFVLLDGTAATPTSFGEFDEDSGIWKPISVSGLTFGTNGFYLDFEASGNLGNDANGGTDLTEVNIAATDQSTDTCTNNFCTLTPLTKLTDATLSEGNLNVTYGTASTRRAVFGSIVVTAGKWFCETKVIATSQTSVEMNLGISNTYNPEAIGNALVSNNGFTVSYFPAGSGGALYIGTTNDESSLGALAVNDIIGMAIDMDNGTLQFYKNGSALGSANDITTGDSDDGELYPGFTIANSCSSGGQTFTASHNFGSPAYSESGGNSDADGFGNFSMSVPSGFFSICTKNLAEYGG